MQDSETVGRERKSPKTSPPIKLQPVRWQARNTRILGVLKAKKDWKCGGPTSRRLRAEGRKMPILPDRASAWEGPDGVLEAACYEFPLFLFVFRIKANCGWLGWDLSLSETR